LPHHNWNWPLSGISWNGFEQNPIVKQLSNHVYCG
jgi:hypothetical protein